MENIDDLIGAETPPIDIREVVDTSLPTLSLPEGMVRNRAATTALLSDPSNMEENFNTMMAESKDGTDAITSGLQDQVVKNVEEKDRSSVVNILADPTIPFDKKKAAIENFNSDQLRKDFGTTLLTNTAEKASKGESVEAEKVRIKTVAEQIKDIYQRREEVQALINSYGATLDASTGKAMVDITSDIVAPFSTNILMATIAQNKKGGTFWDGLKALIRPGATKQNIRDELANIPLSQRAAATQELWDNINKNANTLGISDNHFSKMRLMQELMQGGDYSNTDAWLDTLGGALDLVGLGFAVRAPKAAKALKTAEGITSETKAATKAPIDLATTTGKPTAGVFDERIAALQEKKAGMLGEAGNILEPGAVASLNKEKAQLSKSIPSLNDLAKDIQAEQGITSKEAKARAKTILDGKMEEVSSQISHIDSLIEGNKQAATLMQRIAELEKEIDLLIKHNTPVFLKKTTLADEISRIEMNGVARVANPASPIEIVKLANPQTARDMHAAIILSQGDEIAKAVSGTNKVQAVANNILPQVSKDGRVNVGIVDIDRNLRKQLVLPEAVYRAAHITVDNMLTKGEIELAKANVVNKFNDASGLTMRPSISSFDDDGVKLKINAVYGPSEGDFSNARQAVEQTKYALQKMGIKDEDIELLRRRGLDYEPVKLEEVADVEGSYLVRINTTHTFDPTEVPFYEKSTVRFNWADRIPAMNWDTNKSISNILIDYASMLDPKFTGPMSVGVDKSAKFEKLMLDLANDFAVGFNKLDAASKQKLDRYIKEANFNGIALDIGHLKNKENFSDAMIKAAKDWRTFWDAHYYLENLDVIRTLNNQGFSFLKNKNAELIARQITKDSTIAKVYDPDLDKIVQLSKAELDALYDSGGFYGKLRRPSEIGGELVEHVIVKNTPDSYLRKIRDSDQVLNYREGYYQLQYKAARFVDKITVMPNGKEIRKAVAVSKDSKQAKAFAERMNANASPGTFYRERADDRAFIRGSDDWFDVQEAQGRIAQRHRGKLLESADGVNHLDDGSHILDPATSAIRAARSISGRTVMRPVLDTAKERFMKQYGHLVTNENPFGTKYFPRDKAQIGEKGRHTTKELGDARTTWNYINFMENGYINGMDEMYKQGMSMLAETLGSMDMYRTQRAVSIASEFSPNQAAKGGVFNAYIAGHPLRQLFIQPHQAVRTFAYNTEGWVTGKIPRLTWAYTASKIEGKSFSLPKGISKAELDSFAKFVDESGMIQAVDKNNLIRGSLLDAADHSTGGRLLRAANSPIEFSRKIGFDKGEIANNVLHLAAVYDKYARKGFNMTDPSIIDEARSVTRAIGYDMNAAGDMLINHTAASTILQFMQVPLKAVLNYTNRRIPATDRARLLAGDLIMWGGPAYIISEWFGTSLPDDPKTRNIIVNGLEATILNRVFQELTGDETLKMDWSSLSPADMTGFGKMFGTLLTDGPWKAFVTSPAAQLFGDEGRVRDAFITAGRFFAGISDDQYETPASIADVAVKFGQIYSGFSAATQAYFMLEMGKKESKYGSELRDNVHYAEAMAALIGINEASSKERFELIEKARKDYKKIEEDIKKDLKSIAKYYQDEYHLGVRDPKQLTALTGLIMKRYAEDPAAYAIANKYVAQLIADPDSQLIKIIMETSNFKGSTSFKERLRDLPMKDEQTRQSLMEFIDSVEKQRIE